MTTEIRRPSPRPLCGKCFKPVDVAFSVPIVERGKVIGANITYECHGSEKSFPVTQQWLDEPGNDEKPFVDKVFEPDKVKSVSVEEALIDDYRGKLRKSRIAVWDSMAKVMFAYATSCGATAGKEEQWLAKRNGYVSMSMGDFIAASQEENVFSFVVGGKTVGHFRLPFYPDEQSVEYIPV